MRGLRGGGDAGRAAVPLFWSTSLHKIIRLKHWIEMNVQMLFSGSLIPELGRSIYLSIYLSVCLSIYIYLSVWRLPACLYLFSLW